MDLDDLEVADVAAWRGLASVAADPNPFFEPAYVLAAARHLRVRSALLVASDGDGWAACLPIVRPLRPAPHVAAWAPHLHVFATTPLVDRRRPAAGAEALAGALVRRRVAAWVAFTKLRADGVVARALRDAFDEHGARPYHVERYDRAALLPRRPGAQAPALVTGKRASELRRKARKLGEALGGSVEIAERSGDEGAVSRLLALEHSGWKGRVGTSLAATPGGAAFFTEVCRAFAADGRLALYELTVAGRTVASTVALRAGDGAFGLRVAHDEELARWSPGIQVQVAFGEALIAEGPHTWLDSCSEPDNETQNRMWPDRRDLVRMVLPTRSPLAPFARLAARRMLRDRPGATPDPAPRPAGAARGRSPRVAVDA